MHRAAVSMYFVFLCSVRLLFLFGCTQGELAHLMTALCKCVVVFCLIAANTCLGIVAHASNTIHTFLVEYCSQSLLSTTLHTSHIACVPYLLA
eukprot:m.100698 g.100698  ORF g.100698 m.100698 type:complete len:93 (-) comp13179_c0_seq8:373-651(-)